MAAWFLGLFLFIYAEKLVHTHKEADHVNKKEAHVSASNTCALCDFQPGKDAELSPAAINKPPFLFIAVLTEKPAVILHVLYYSAHGDRGPPSVL